MTQHGNDTPDQVLKFVPKEKAQNKVPQVDEAGEAIVAQIRTAADLAKEDCDRAMSLAHKLSRELRAAEDRTPHLRTFYSLQNKLYLKEGNNYHEVERHGDDVCNDQIAQLLMVAYVIRGRASLPGGFC
jgi:hypothetical protein